MNRGLGEAIHAGRRWILQSANALDLETAVSPSVQFLLFVVLLIILPTRRLGLFLHPNFYAEDAEIWYAQAYSGGWLHSLTLPAGGYLNTLQRLLTGVAMLVPFHLAPIVDAVMGLLLQVVPVCVLLSARCRNWSPLSVRCVFAGLYAFFPNGSETHVVLTNSQWHLALVLLLLAFGEPPISWWGKTIDAGFFLLAGFCGPFGVLLVPVILLSWILVRPKRWAVFQTLLVSAGACVQVDEVLHGSGREYLYLGASLGRFLRMLGGEVFLGSMLGPHLRFNHPPVVFASLGLLFGIVIIASCLRFSPLPLRLFLLFAALSLAPALYSPIILGPKPQWELLLDDQVSRYWFLPGLGFLWGAAWCARFAPAAYVRRTGVVVLLLTCIGICDWWRYTPFPAVNFAAAAREFEAASPGTHVRIPIYPDPGRYVELVKR